MGACGVDMLTDMSQEPLESKFTGKLLDTLNTTTIEHRALTPTVRTPQWPHCLGKYMEMYGHIFQNPWAALQSSGTGKQVSSSTLQLHPAALATKLQSDTLQHHHYI